MNKCKKEGIFLWLYFYFVSFYSISQVYSNFPSFNYVPFSQKTSHCTAYQILFFPCNFFSFLTHSQLSFLLPGIDFSLNFHESEKSESVSTQLCPTLCDPMNCSLPGYSVHGILQARLLEWVAIPFR